MIFRNPNLSSALLSLTVDLTVQLEDLLRKRRARFRLEVGASSARLSTSCLFFFANSLLQFWDAQAPEPPHYFATQWESRNAVLFNMMQAALSKDKAKFGPILVDPSPKTWEVAEANLLAFSNEGLVDNASMASEHL